LLFPLPLPVLFLSLAGIGSDEPYARCTSVVLGDKGDPSISPDPMGSRGAGAGRGAAKLSGSSNTAVSVRFLPKFKPSRKLLLLDRAPPAPMDAGTSALRRLRTKKMMTRARRTPPAIPAAMRAYLTLLDMGWSGAGAGGTAEVDGVDVAEMDVARAEVEVLEVAVVAVVANDRDRVLVGVDTG
jgi:hypothetical protein